MRVFLSWSGKYSQQVAAVLHGWLPVLFDNVQPWMSDLDIGAGQRGLAEIERSLKDAAFGIVVVTAENQHSTWINFEAGALSKEVDSAQRVAPLLVDLGSPTDLAGPMAQFQINVLDHEGLLRIAQSIGEIAGISAPIIERRFDAMWPELEASLKAIQPPAPSATDADEPPGEGVRTDTDLLVEILTTVRALRRDQAPDLVSHSPRFREVAGVETAQGLFKSIPDYLGGTTDPFALTMPVPPSVSSKLTAACVQADAPLPIAARVRDSKVLKELIATFHAPGSDQVLNKLREARLHLKDELITWGVIFLITDRDGLISVLD